MELLVHLFQSLAHAHMVGERQIVTFLSYLLPQTLRTMIFSQPPIILAIRPDEVR